MTDAELIDQLRAIKEKITEMGYNKIRDTLPIYLDDFRKFAAPFINLERAVDKEIKKLEKQKSCTH